MNSNPSIYKALSHPTRLEIIRILAKDGAQNCGSLVTRLDFAQSTISQHLQALLDGDLITRKSIKTESIYEINWETFRSGSQEMLLFIKEILAFSVVE